MYFNVTYTPRNKQTQTQTHIHANCTCINACTYTLARTYTCITPLSTGLLLSTDTYMNLQLDQTKEYIDDKFAVFFLSSYTHTHTHTHTYAHTHTHSHFATCVCAFSYLSIRIL